MEMTEILKAAGRPPRPIEVGARDYPKALSRNVDQSRLRLQRDDQVVVGAKTLLQFLLQKLAA